VRGQELSRWRKKGASVSAQLEFEAAMSATDRRGPYWSTACHQTRTSSTAQFTPCRPQIRRGIRHVRASQRMRRLAKRPRPIRRRQKKSPRNSMAFLWPWTKPASWDADIQPSRSGCHYLGALVRDNREGQTSRRGTPTALCLPTSQSDSRRIV